MTTSTSSNGRFDSLAIDPLAVAASLTEAERITLLAGADTWHTAAVPRVGLASLRTTDGPSGARGTSHQGPASACFPCGTSLASSWDPDLVHEIGAALGREARSKRANVILAPTVNLHRTPIGGRNFECLSEDPHLSAELAVAYVNGVQSEGVAACIKHFVANDTEYERMSISSEVDERTLRELYLVPFEAVVTRARVRSIMTSYNRINGTYAADHRELIQHVLRDEWGFDGLVMSDWFGLHSTAEGLLAGVDLEMPGPSRWRGAKLQAAIDAAVGTDQDDLGEALARSSQRIVDLVAWTGADHGVPGVEATPERTDDDPALPPLLRRAAVAGTVLLRNDGVLPLRRDRTYRVAVLGPNAVPGQIQGGGSANVRPVRGRSVVDALRAGGVEVVHERGCVIAKRAPAVRGGPFLSTIERPGQAPVTSEGRSLGFADIGGQGTGAFALTSEGPFTPDEDGTWTFSLTSVGPSQLWIDGVVVVDNSRPIRGDTFYGLGSTEVRAVIDLQAGREYAIRLTYERAEKAMLGAVVAGCLPPEPEDLLDRAVAAAAAADLAVVVVGTNDDWESEGGDRATMDLPGRQDELIARVAAAQPRTVVVINAGSPVSMPWDDDVSSVLQCWFAGQEQGDALADVLLGEVSPGGRLPVTIPVRLEDTPAFLSHPGEAGRAVYGEGVFIGYRWYGTRRIPVRYPFGHGLSYTTFEWGAPDVTEDGDEVVIRVAVTNSGDAPGAEVVQCYVAPVGETAAVVRRPAQELRAFERLALDPGATGTASLRLGRRAFSRWDPARSGWVVDPGSWEVRLGPSSADVRSRVTIDR